MSKNILSLESKCLKNSLIRILLRTIITIFLLLIIILPLKLKNAIRFSSTLHVVIKYSFWLACSSTSFYGKERYSVGRASTTSLLEIEREVLRVNTTKFPSFVLSIYLG